MPLFTITLSDVITDIAADSEEEAVAVAQERRELFGPDFSITTVEEGASSV